MTRLREPSLRGIEKRGRVYWFKRSLTPELAKAINGGRRLYLRNLKTRDLTTAIKRAAAIRATFEKAEDEGYENPASRDLKDLAAILKFALEIATSPPIGSDGEVVSEVISDMAEEIEKTHGLEVAQAFHAVASGSRHLLSELVEQYVMEKNLSRSRHVRLRWALSKIPHITFLEDVADQRQAGEITTALLKSNLRRSSAQLVTKTLTALWSFGVLKDYIKVNPFTRRGVTGVPKTDKRALTREELGKLMSNPCDLREKHLVNLMFFLSCTGMRSGEACSIRCSDVRDGWIYIRDGKTPNARRKIRIAGQRNVTLVEQLMRGKHPDAALIGIVKDTLARRIRNYSVKILGRDVVKGFLDTHSFRRTFATAAEASGLDDLLFKRMIGHSRSLSLWQSTYSGGAQDVSLKDGFERIAAWLGEAVRSPQPA